MDIFKKNKISLPKWIKKVEERKTIRIFRLQGELGMAAVAELEQFAVLARSQKDYEFKHILLDFADVSSMDSSAVAALLKALRDYKKRHQMLVIVNLNENPKNMIRLAKVGHLFPSYATEAEAIQDLETRF